MVFLASLQVITAHQKVAIKTPPELTTRRNGKAVIEDKFKSYKKFYFLSKSKKMKKKVIVIMPHYYYSDESRNRCASEGLGCSAENNRKWGNNKSRTNN